MCCHRKSMESRSKYKLESRQIRNGDVVCFFSFGKKTYPIQLKKKSVKRQYVPPGKEKMIVQDQLLCSCRVITV